MYNISCRFLKTQKTDYWVRGLWPYCLYTPTLVPPLGCLPTLMCLQYYTVNLVFSLSMWEMLDWNLGPADLAACKPLSALLFNPASYILYLPYCTYIATVNLRMLRIKINHLLVKYRRLQSARVARSHSPIFSSLRANERNNRVALPANHNSAPQNNHTQHNSSVNTCDLLSDPSGK